MHGIDFGAAAKFHFHKVTSSRQISLSLQTKVFLMDAVQSIFGKTPRGSRLQWIQKSRSGISAEEMKKVQSFTELSMKELSDILPISERQLNRYDKNHILRKDISSHLLQLVELYEKGYEVFGKEKFQKWLRSDIAVFGNQKPLEFLDTPIGIQYVYDILGRIEHGVYS